MREAVEGRQDGSPAALLQSGVPSACSQGPRERSDRPLRDDIDAPVGAVASGPSWQPVDEAPRDCDRRSGIIDGRSDVDVLRVGS